MANKQHCVLGASGGAGNAIVRSLVEQGEAVRAVNRSGNAQVPEGVERMGADISEVSEANDAVSGVDVVYMATQPAYHRWSEEFPGMLDTVIDATARSGARLVMVDNLYMYPPTIHKMSESSPETSGTSKGRVRIELTRMLRDAHDTEKVRVTIGRASDYFGPGADNSAITALTIDRAANGKAMRWMGRLDKQHSVAYLPDIARAYVMLGRSDEAAGETWILPHGQAPTGAEFLAAVNAALDEPVKTGALSKRMLTMAAPFHRLSRESLEMMGQWTSNFVVDDSKFQGVFGPFDTTPLDEAVSATLERYHGLKSEKVA